MYVIIKYSNFEPIDADCESLIFWKILEVEYVEYFHLKIFKRGGGRGIRKKKIF